MSSALRLRQTTDSPTMLVRRVARAIPPDILVVVTASRAYAPLHMQSKAATVEQYLAELPEDRRAAIQTVRQVILRNLDRDYEEGMQYGLIGYFVPHRVFPAGYHCDPSKPLPFVNLASQKNHMAVYMMSVYGGTEEKWFRSAWAKTGKKLDMGKCCIRFRRVDDLALDVLAEAIRRAPAKTYIEHYEAALREASRKKQRFPKAAPGKPPARSAKTARSARRVKPAGRVRKK